MKTALSVCAGEVLGLLNPDPPIVWVSGRDWPVVLAVGVLASGWAVCRAFTAAGDRAQLVCFSGAQRPCPGGG